MSAQAQCHWVSISEDKSAGTCRHNQVPYEDCWSRGPRQLPLVDSIGRLAENTAENWFWTPKRGTDTPLGGALAPLQAITMLHWTDAACTEAM